MKKKIIALLPFVIMPVFIPIYMVLDNLLLVEIFGCGCVPSTQTNILNMPFNANDLRLTVCSLLTIVLSIWSITLSKRFNKKMMEILYIAAVILLNVSLTMWTVKTFMWA